VNGRSVEAIKDLMEVEEQDEDDEDSGEGKVERKEE